jgi:hypothetical protein
MATPAFLYSLKKHPWAAEADPASPNFASAAGGAVNGGAGGGTVGGVLSRTAGPGAVVASQLAAEGENPFCDPGACGKPPLCHDFPTSVFLI